MKRIYFVCLLQSFASTFLLSQSNPVPLITHSTSVVAPISASQTDPQAQVKILDSYGKLPLSFEVNHGQTDSRVKFLSRASGYTLFLTGDEAVLALTGKKATTDKAKIACMAHTLRSGMAESKAGRVLRMKLRNADPAAKVTGMNELAGTSNYFIGNDPTKWRTNVPTYARVRYEGIYSGVDLVYYGNQRQLEYDFILAPGADPHRIVFDVRGAKRIRRDGKGELVFKVGEDEIRWHKPVVYQEKNGARQEIAAHYGITDTNRVTFELAKYDTSRPLYVDPLIYSTYLGGSGNDQSNGIAVDSDGNAYIMGLTYSTDFPTQDPLQPANVGGANGTAFVTKINAAGSALVYSTYLGGSGGDSSTGIAVDSAGNTYVTGHTASTDFPTKNPLRPANDGGEDAFVTKINPAGSTLVYSTYLGGSGNDGTSGIALDISGDAYVTGTTFSANFPVTPGAFQTVCAGGMNCEYGEVFVTKINAAGSALAYSTYMGGSYYSYGTGIAVDSSGDAYITGYTTSADFPTTPGAFQTVCDGGWGCNYYPDAFVSKLNPTGSSLVYSTFLGGNLTELCCGAVDSGYAIAVDGAESAYVTGFTSATNFPTTSGAFQTACNRGRNCLKYGDAFVSKLNPAGSALVYSTFLGGGLSDIGYGIAVGSSGSVYVTGQTYSTNFPTESPFQKRNAGAGDAFVSRLNPAGSALVYSSFLGGSGDDYGSGIAVDNSGYGYVIGTTGSTNFSTMNSLQPASGGGDDAFVAKIGMEAVTTTTLSSSPNPSTEDQDVTFTAVVTSSLGTPPDGETITFLEGKKTLGTGALSGGSATFMTSALPPGTNLIQAVYAGDSNFAGSKSNVVEQVVEKAGE
jgi:hypothetical protein